MVKKKSSNLLEQVNHHHLIPSTAGGVVAYLLSGVLLLGLAVFASVWVGHIIGHKLHKK